MKQFEHTIRKPGGICVRPAGEIFKVAKAFPDTVVTISRGSKSAKAFALLGLLQLGVRQGETVTVTIDGPNEMAATVAMQNYFWNHL